MVQVAIINCSPLWLKKLSLFLYASRHIVPTRFLRRPRADVVIGPYRIYIHRPYPRQAPLLFQASFVQREVAEHSEVGGIVLPRGGGGPLGRRGLLSTPPPNFTLSLHLTLPSCSGGVFVLWLVHGM